MDFGETGLYVKLHTHMHAAMQDTGRGDIGQTVAQTLAFTKHR